MLPRLPLSLTMMALALAPLASALPLLPPGATGIGPGTHLLVDLGEQTVGCTAGWLWRDASATYLSAAGHCFLPENASATHGGGAGGGVAATVWACIDRCEFGGQSGFLLTGDLVELGPVAYARQRVGAKEIGNDFGLVKVPDAHLDKLRAGLPVWGKPTRVHDPVAGDAVCYFGAGVVVGETSPTMARRGAALMTLSDGSWRMAAASAPGDSGAAIATCTPEGRAIGAAGTLTHLAGGTIAGTTMARAQEMAREAGLNVVPWIG